MSAWLFALRSEAGLHLAVQVHDAADSQKVLAAARRHLPGIASIAELSQATDAAPGLVFGFGCIKVEKSCYVLAGVCSSAGALVGAQPNHHRGRRRAIRCKA
ncbi:hypothetical protein ABE493_16085 [Stenotrophomonas terrae]|uniref:hypothetical protein n=1 Tax=Stenotrophomonas terrae TaxID=405446 RepID=UPI00320AC0E8